MIEADKFVRLNSAPSLTLLAHDKKIGIILNRNWLNELSIPSQANEKKIN